MRSRLPRFLTTSKTIHLNSIRFKSQEARNSSILEQYKQDGIPTSLVHDEFQYRPQKSILSKVGPVQPNDAFVLCTTFDVNGNVTGVSQKFPKMKFLRDNNLFPRDLRKIDSSSIDVVPSIMVRSPDTILVNLLHIKAIIKSDTVMVFDTSTQDVAQKLGLFMYDLEMKLVLPGSTGGTLYYEFRALESILINIMGYLEDELKILKSSCLLILAHLEDQVDRGRLQELLIRLKSLQSFYQRALLIRDVLEDLLDNDEDLEGMYLSNPAATPNDFEEVEMILESYYNHSDEIVQQAGSLINDIKATEEIVNIMLDANRNSMMLFELKLTVYTLGFTVATIVPAFYGMNLKNYIEETNYGFGAVVVISVLQAALITIFNFRKLDKVQRLTMMSNDYQQNQVSFYHRYRDRMWNRQTWAYRVLHGSRNTTYQHQTLKDKDALWRMINDDKSPK